MTLNGRYYNQKVNFLKFWLRIKSFYFCEQVQKLDIDASMQYADTSKNLFSQHFMVIISVIEPMVSTWYIITPV